MKKHLTNKMMQSDIRKAKLNIFDSKAMEKLKENLNGAWQPNNGLDADVLHKLDVIGLENLTHLEQTLQSQKTLELKDLLIQKELESLQEQERERKNEEHHLLNLANYLIEASVLAEITLSLKNALSTQDHKQIKQLLKQFKTKLKTLPLRTEEDMEIFKQLEKELHPLLITIEKTTDHPHLITDAENLLHLIQQKQAPQKWKHAA